MGRSAWDHRSTSLPTYLRCRLPELPAARLALDPGERQGAPAGRLWRLLGAAEPELLAQRPCGGPPWVPGGLLTGRCWGFTFPRGELSLFSFQFCHIFLSF